MIGLIAIDGPLPNIPLMKISSYYKHLGEKVEFVQPGEKYEKIYASAIFTRSIDECRRLKAVYGDRIEIGGSGWNLAKKLPDEIERCQPDYDLYTIALVAPRLKGIMTKQRRIKKAQEIVDAGVGFTSRGCIRNCKFCIVPQKEGKFRQDQEIGQIINPRSNTLILNDNNFTADPNCIPKLKEIVERGLVLDINQGLDVRLMNDEIAFALSRVRHLRRLHYAWDRMEDESFVMSGIEALSKYIRPYKHMCFMLVGFDTSFEQDMYRFRRLVEIGIDPYVMVYNQIPDKRLHHFARWVNGHFFHSCSFEEYVPWVLEQQQLSFGLY